MSSLKLSIVCLCLWPLCQVPADVVVLSNGDHITGTVTRKTGETLMFHSTLAGELKIPWENVQSLKTDLPVKVLRPGATMAEEVLAFDRAAPSLAPGDLVNPKSWRLGEQWDFSGLVNFALNFQQGNGKRDDLELDTALQLQKYPHRMNGLAEFEIDEQEGDAPNSKWVSKGDYNYFTGAKGYRLVSVSLESDEFALLDLRSIGGLGFGYQFFDKKSLRLNTEVKGLRVVEEFEVDPNDEFWAAGWEVGLEKTVITDWVLFYVKHSGVLNVEDTDKGLYNLWSGFRIPLGNGLLGIAELRGFYNSSPPEDTEDKEVTYRLKIGYEW